MQLIRTGKSLLARGKGGEKGQRRGVGSGLKLILFKRGLKKGLSFDFNGSQYVCATGSKGGENLGLKICLGREST